MKLILKILVLLFAGGLVLTWRTQTSDQQTAFLAGKAFAVMPDGFWKGSADFPVGSWQGKRFNGPAATGLNVFSKNGTTTESIPFVMKNGPALWDKNITVTQFDYNLPENPFYLRPAIDEVVEVAPGKLLGKIHYRLFPGFSVALGYFTQEQK